MFSSQGVKANKIKFITVSITSASLIFLAVSGISAQDSLRESVYGKPKTTTTSPSKSTSKSKPTPPKPTPPVKRKLTRSQVKNFTKPSKPSNKKELLTVSFTAKEPMIEVWINDKNVGVTDGNFEFSKKLAPGEYTLMAKSNGEVISESRKITVSPEENSFELFVEEEQPEEISVIEPKEPEVKKKSEMEIALEVSNEIKRILETYANPEMTDSIGEDDWQVVFQAAQLGQLQGYTAVQIEAQRWFASGKIEFSKGEFANALTAFNKAQEFMPSSALPFYELGNTYFANKQLPDALKCYIKALQLDPKLAMAYKKFGDAQRLSGKEKEAISAYKNAIKFEYKTPETHYWLGSLLLENKQTEEGIKELELVAKNTPGAEVFIKIGMGYEKLKRNVSAIENYRKAIEYDKNSAAAYYKLADVYFGLRELDKAKVAYEKAIELDPNGKHGDRKDAQKKLREVSTKLTR